MQLYFIILALIGVIVFQELRHGKERKDLYNRIMARDLTEYQRDIDKTPRVARNIIRKNLAKQHNQLLDDLKG